ncbi:hypothetical protein ONZ45_g4510 [Pleurotus djamor]|nr:hypothetical protein ONZ45_g18409 [Pleurotus djamor]KAJ8518387.1 hypothetical protein ONZ45_g4510 [Pleurotus djamor]
MRSSILVLLFAAVFVLARPIEDIVDTQNISDLADKGKPAAKKPAPKKPTTSTKTKSTSSKSGAVKGAVVDILG